MLQYIRFLKLFANLKKCLNGEIKLQMAMNNAAVCHHFQDPLQKIVSRQEMYLKGGRGRIETGTVVCQNNTNCGENILFLFQYI